MHMKMGAWIFWSLLVSAAGFRFVTAGIRPILFVDPCSGEKVFAEGMIEAEPERKDSGQIFLLRARTISPTVSVSDVSKQCGTDILVRVKTKLYPRFAFGDIVSASGKISTPRNFKSEDGRAFDYVNYLAKDGVHLEMKSAIVKKIDSPREGEESLGLLKRTESVLYGIKRSFVASLERSLGDPHAALASGLVVGEKAALGKDLLDDFRAVGLIHIVVLSGYNITIIADALRKMLSSLPRTWGIIAGALGIVAFGVMVGGGATVVRSCFMACIALSADLARRDYDVRIALVFAGLAMLIENPRILLFDPSFQLSFLATVGLIALASPLEKRLGWITERYGMRGIVASTLATQVFVSPFILYMMGQLSIIGMVVNILVLPFIPLTMLVVATTGLAGMTVPIIGQAVGWVAHLLLSYELVIVEEFAKFSFSSIHVPKFSGAIVIVFYAVLVSFFLMRNIPRSSLPQNPN